MNEIRYPYKPKKITSIFAIAMFALGAFVFFHLANTNDRGVIINHILKLSVEHATIFYWVLFTVCVLFVVVGTISLVISLTKNRDIILTEDSISSPKHSWSSKIITVHYTDITDTKIRTINKQVLLYIVHRRGKLVIPQSMLPNKNSFNEMTQFLAAKIQH